MSRVPSSEVLQDITKALAQQADLKPPKICILPLRSKMAAVVSLPVSSVMFLSEGLLDHLLEDEIKAVIAHEIAHLYHHDFALRFFAFWALGLAMVWGAVFLTVIMQHDHGSSLGVMAAWLGALAILREQEYRADQTAASFTQDPNALMRAIDKIHGKEGPQRCWGLLATHPSAPKRIQQLG